MMVAFASFPSSAVAMMVICPSREVVALFFVQWMEVNGPGLQVIQSLSHSALRLAKAEPDPAMTQAAASGPATPCVFS